MIRRRVLVHGRVQGVFFRDSCRQQAQRSDVRGWVRNTSDGAVEAVFEGSAGDVERLCEWCRDGPPRAQVDRVEVAEEAPRAVEGFEVR